MIPRSDRYAMLNTAEKLSLRGQCELLCIPRTNFYYKPKPMGKINLHIMRLMDEQYLKTPFYGFPRMYDHIVKSCHDLILNRKRVYRLYKLMNLKSLLPGPHTSKSDPKAIYKFPYLLKGLVIEKPNYVWAADITYIPISNGYMFLFAIIDLYSRYIVNWALANNMNAEWCASTTQEAIYKSGKPIIFNTDQGSQFTSEIFVDLMKTNQIKLSMDGKGRAIDNIFIERFWRTVKYEYVYINRPNGGHELYFGIEEYIRYYNYERPHESLGKKTPASMFGAKDYVKVLTKYSTKKTN
jgi:putative transposase